MNAVKDCIRELCVLSVFCGAVLSLCPEGGVKRILRVLEVVVLLAVILNGIGRLDLSPNTLELARLQEKEKELLNGTEEMKNRLDRFVIEEEYRSYVQERAETAGVAPTEILIRTRWSTEGFWIPDSSRICLDGNNARNTLSAILSGELGIPPDRQEWVADE